MKHTSQRHLSFNLGFTQNSQTPHLVPTVQGLQFLSLHFLVGRFPRSFRTLLEPVCPSVLRWLFTGLAAKLELMEMTLPSIAVRVMLTGFDTELILPEPAAEVMFLGLTAEVKFTKLSAKVMFPVLAAEEVMLTGLTAEVMLT